VAEKAGLQLTADECRVVNRIIDDAVAGAVDIFARKQAAELLRQRDEHLAFIVHDVRVPLNAIGLIATLLSEELGPQAREPVEMLQTLQRNVDRIEELIHQILEKDRNQRPPDGLNLVRREFDLWPLVQQLVQTLQPIAAAAQVKIRNLVPRRLTLNADAVLLARAVQNVVSNAIKFAPNGEIEIGAAETAAEVECWVKDNGAGIAPEHLESIFDKHETDADPLRAGFGLGLAIFKKIIEAHGGKITVQSQPGQGATFRFSIPKTCSK
jgi:signal transduction histidine kinase